MAAGVWGILAALIIVPLIIAAQSPYLPSRDAAYVVSSFAGILCLGLFVIQPLMGAQILPFVARAAARRWHRVIGTTIVGLVAVHIGGLYLTSPADTVDALLLRAPTPFSVFGVIAMCGIIVVVWLVLARKRLRLRYPVWHVMHSVLTLGIVIACVIHALQIAGTMGPISKWMLCSAAVIAVGVAAVDVRLMRPSRLRQSRS